MTRLETHFSLTGPLFPKTPADGALLRHNGMQEVLARLQFALERDTIALLVGESGCGKSTVLSLFAKSLDAASYLVLTTSLTTLGPFSLIAHLLALLGLPARRFKGEAAAALLAHLRSQPRRAVVLVDESHLMPDQSLEDLRLLTADDLDRRSPFSLVLAGQPLLRDRLAEPQHYALWQRVGVRLRLRPLTESELPGFLERQLRAAGVRKSLFDAEAVAAIFQHSRGVPRLAQHIALHAMLAAMAAGHKTVDAGSVQQAVVDLEAS